MKYLVKEANPKADRLEKRYKKERKGRSLSWCVYFNLLLGMGCPFKEATEDLGMIEI